MHIVNLNEIAPGICRLARPVFDENGTCLYASGQQLGCCLLRQLTELRIEKIVVEDEMTREVRFPELIASPVWIDWVRQTRDIYKMAAGGPLDMQKIEEIVTAMLDMCAEKKVIVPLPSGSVPERIRLYAHAVNVALWSLQIGLHFPYTNRQLFELGVGGLLHDIGKERAASRREHPQAGYEMLQGHPDISVMSAMIALQHHEALNGTGYPQELRGEAFGEQPQICGIANLFEKFAETCRSMYAEALDIVQAFQSTCYHASVVAAAVRTIPRYLPGCTIRIHNSEPAIVLSLSDRHQPLLRFVHTGRYYTPSLSSSLVYEFVKS